MGGLFSPQAWAMVWTYRATFLHGLGNTVQLAAAGLMLALALGMCFGLLSTSGKKPLTALARVYVEFVQNTPLLLQMCFLYYLLAFSGNSLGILPTGMIALGVYHGAYLSEVIRAGIQAIPRGQSEAAQAQGFGYLGRMYYVILPPERQDHPAAHGQPGGEPDQEHLLPVHRGRRRPDLGDLQLCHRRQHRGAYAPAYIVSGLLFFVVCFPLSTLASVWETALKKRDARTTAARVK